MLLLPAKEDIDQHAHHRRIRAPYREVNSYRRTIIYDQQTVIRVGPSHRHKTAESWRRNIAPHVAITYRTATGVTSPSSHCYVDDAVRFGSDSSGYAISPHRMP